MHKIHIVPSSDMHLVVGHSRLDPGSPFPPERPAEWQKPVESVVGNPRNPNVHPERQIELLAKIISAQGWRAPITVSTRSGFVVRGHGRL
jgi:hypothetical protein